MSDLDIKTTTTRSFPELRDFLEKEILGPDYPVKHTIEQARAKGHISRGKRGRGGASVTTRDMAVILAGSLAGDTPSDASDAMSALAELRPHASTHGVHFPTYLGLPEDWWNESFLETFCTVIDAMRAEGGLDFHEFEISVVREPQLSARIRWTDVPGERDEHVSYVLGSKPPSNTPSKGKRVIRASLFWPSLHAAADWLEGRSIYCE